MLEPASSGSTRRPAGPPRARVLVVEDDPDLRESVEGAVRTAGHEAVSVGDGSAALDRMREWRPDVVLLDLRLPVMDGWQVLAAKRRDPSIQDIPVIVVSGDSSPVAAAVNAELYILKPCDATTVLQSIADVLFSAELRRDPQRVALNERMAALGTLAAGLAHEINNPLTYVILQLERAAGVADGVGEEDLRAHLDLAHQRALEGAFRIRDIAHDVSAFSRAEPESRSPVDVRQAVLVASRLIRHRLAPPSRLEIAAGGTAFVLASEGKLVQVFLNLLVNAAQAMPEHGRHGFEVRVSCGQDRDGWASVEVTDNGVGIPPHVIGRVFEPFFTTKGDQQGTGLGLSVSHGIVSSFGGEITVTSAAGRGTTFRVRLPPAAGGPARAAAPPRPTSEPRGRRGRILVIDDEPNLRAAVAEALSADEVVAVGSGREALEVLRCDDRFDVVLCDVHIGDMDGKELFAALLEGFPRLAPRVRFMTGGAMSNSDVSFLESRDHEVLHKPFTAQRLRELVDLVCGSDGLD